MSDNPDYVREIEKYFLSLAGEGIMLSSMDYSLIRDWKKRNVPRELVLRGIQKAFSEIERKDQAGKARPRSLKQCTRYIDQCIADYGPGYREGREKRTVSAGTGAIIEEISRALSRLISDETKGDKREYYLGLRRKLLELGDTGSENLYKKICEMEEESLDLYFEALPDKAKSEINGEAEKMIEGRARYMTDSAYRESLNSFRNDIICERYGLKGINSILRD